MNEFSNETIDLAALPKYEEIVLTAPHRNYWKVIVIDIVICLMVAGIGLAILFFNKENIRPYLNIAIAAYSIIAILLFLLFRVNFKKRGYALREKDIVYKSGVIAETTVIVPINKIQHVAIAEGIFSRMYGLATLQIYTASGQSGHINIAGIPIEKAKLIKEALLKRIDLLANL